MVVQVFKHLQGVLLQVLTTNGRVRRGLLSARQKGRSGIPGGKSNLCSEIRCWRENSGFLLSFLRANRLP